MNVAPGNVSALDKGAVVIAALAAVTLLLELTWPHELKAVARDEQAAGHSEEAGPDIPAIGPLSAYLSIGERPLFMHDRQPFAVVVEAAPPAPAGPRVEFELTAVIITSATQIALMRSNLTPKVQRVTRNQTVDGWTLTDVSPEAVVLRRGTETMTVSLRPDVGRARPGEAVRVGTLGAGD